MEGEGSRVEGGAWKVESNDVGGESVRQGRVKGAEWKVKSGKWRVNGKRGDDDGAERGSALQQRLLGWSHRRGQGRQAE